MTTLHESVREYPSLTRRCRRALVAQKRIFEMTSHFHDRLGSAPPAVAELRLVGERGLVDLEACYLRVGIPGLLSVKGVIPFA